VVGVFAFGGEFSSWYFDFGMNDFGEINHEATKSAKGRKKRREKRVVFNLLVSRANSKIYRFSDHLI
jgi:hypothetical protein